MASRATSSPGEAFDVHHVADVIDDGDAFFDGLGELAVRVDK